MSRTIRAGGLAALLALAAAGAAFAQSGSSSASAYTRGSNAGYSGMSTPVNASVRDANGNLTILDGVIQTGNDSSVFGKLSTSGALDQFSGAGGVTTSSGGTSTGTATAIGNNLVVVTSGSYNTVIVNANQTNNGAVTATTTVLNGQVNLND
jgi:holdfast attachment protein HfaA